GAPQGCPAALHHRLQEEPARHPAHARAEADRRRRPQGGSARDPRHAAHGQTPDRRRGGRL
ncbi:MAG: LSU ribosomal protein L30p (L7e), partial [uncultured Nocardioidaceae bacterium]